MIERALAVFLLNALWEPLAVAVCAFAVLRGVRSSNAATRCAVLTSAIIAALLLPPITTAAVVSHESTSVQQISPSRPEANWTAVAPPHRAATRAAAEPETTIPSVYVPRRAVLEVPHTAVLIVVLLWAVVAAALLVRLLLSLRHLARLRRDALPLSPDLRAQLRRWTEKAGGIDVRLCLSDETEVPIAIGLFDCMVLIPRRLLPHLDPADLDRIVLHEIAHLRRRDALVFAIQQTGCALYFFSPAVAWLARTLDLEREIACDDWVCERRADAAPYAQCLVRLAEGVPWPHKALPTPGAFVTRHSMSVRIERILRRARDAQLRAAPAPVAAAIVAAGAVAAVGLSFAPSLAFTSPERSARIAHVHRPAAPVHAHRAEREGVVPFHAVTYHAILHNAVAYHTVMHHAVAYRLLAQAAATPTAAPAARPTAKPAAKPFAKPTLRPPARMADPDGDYITQMRSIFGNGLSVNDLVALKSVGVTPVYVQQMRAAGLDVATARTAISARAVGITPEKVAQMRAAFGTLSFDDLMALVSLRVDPAYRSEMQGAGVSNLTTRRLIALKSVGVTGDYVRQADAMGFGTLSSDQLVTLKSMQIDSAFIERVRQHGFSNLTLEQLIQLKASGVIK